MLARLPPAVRRRGLLPVARDTAGWTAGWVAGRPRAGRPGGPTFVLDGSAVPYARHAYHFTWLNERAVEVALGLPLLAAHRPARVLEIGNVLRHYAASSHLVVDRYERAPGVLNADVAELDLAQRYDLVLAISTLEHVGLDEPEQDPGKPARAVQRLRGLLAPGGRLWVTVPVGYNPAFDDALRRGEVEGASLRALRRAPCRNRWQQVPVDEVWDAPYDRLLYTAHGLLLVDVTAGP